MPVDETERQIYNESGVMEILGAIKMENTLFFASEWKFEVEEIPRLGWFVNIAFQRPDTETGVWGTGRGRKEYIQIGAWFSGIVKTAGLCLELVARHEFMESLKFNGRRIYNPHKNINQL